MNVETDVREELGKLPQSLTLIYVKIYEQMSDVSRASRVILERSLKWLLCMQKRLSTAEFVAAVSINLDGTVGKVSKELILHICSNFVVLDTELDTFRFAHLSVVEFLESQTEYALTWANATAAETCIVICLGRCIGPAIVANNLLQYHAVLSWAYHCQLAEYVRSKGT